MNCYFCDACHYCFTAEQLPDGTFRFHGRANDITIQKNKALEPFGKQEIHGHLAVRMATEAEIMDYRQIQMELNEEESHAAGKEAAGYESDSYISHGTNLRQSHVRL